MYDKTKTALTWRFSYTNTQNLSDKKKDPPKIEGSLLVRITGVEPAPSCPDWHLKPARLPIPPYPHL